MTSLKGLEALIDWFMPAEFSQDAHSRKRVRMFLISHIFGPILGAPIPIFLYLYDPQPFPHVSILAAQIAAFWLFPLALKLLPATIPAWLFSPRSISLVRSCGGPTIMAA